MWKKLSPVVRGVGILGVVGLMALVGCRSPRGISRDDDSSPATASELTAADLGPSKNAPPPAAPSSLDTSKLRIVEGKTGTDPETGYLHLYGVVTNETGQPVEGVKVTLELFDPSGAPIDVDGWHKVAQKEAHAGDKEYTRGEVHYLPPGASTPYHYLRDPHKMKGTYGSHKLTATARARTAPMPTAQIASVTTTVVPNGFGEVTLRGTFVNGREPCRSPTAFFGFFEGAKLVALVTPHQNALDTHFQKKLSPGQSIPFEGKSFPQAPANAQVKTWASCDNWMDE